jgi:hypothetical protein
MRQLQLPRSEDFQAIPQLKLTVTNSAVAMLTIISELLSMNIDA